MRICIIGSGIGGLAAAVVLAKQGHEVVVYEKNEQLGGRASVWEQDGFRWDMGPSWYLMPDVFEMFFSAIGENVHDYLRLHKLSPSYRVFFHKGRTVVDVHDDLEKNRERFEMLEPGCMAKLATYLQQAEYQYRIAIEEFVLKNYDSIRDFFTRRMITQGYKLSVFESMQKYVRRYFRTSEMQKILQYPLVFLGTDPGSAPALYRIMNHVDFGLGVWYPLGGIHTVVDALVAISRKYNIVFHTQAEVAKILVSNGVVRGIQLSGGEQVVCDAVVSNADMRWTETHLLPSEYQTYPSFYRNKKVIAPGAFILYLGIKGKLESLLHHTLLFSDDWDANFREIFTLFTPPSDPSLYICCPSKTDPCVAPSGYENIFVLVPFPPGISLTQAEVLKYRNKILHHIEEIIGEKFVDRIVVEKIFWNQDFFDRYYAYRGSALGLAHTLLQTAIFRPRNISKKVKGLYYVGSYTHPGIGMPMCLLSGLLVGHRFLGKNKT